MYEKSISFRFIDRLPIEIQQITDVVYTVWYKIAKGYRWRWSIFVYLSMCNRVLGVLLSFLLFILICFGFPNFAWTNALEIWIYTCKVDGDDFITVDLVVLAQFYFQISEKKSVCQFTILPLRKTERDAECSPKCLLSTCRNL